MYSFQMQFLSTVSIQCIDYASPAWLDYIKIVSKHAGNQLFHSNLHGTLIILWNKLYCGVLCMGDFLAGDLTF
jgi:hypothetical protein